jgi:hypothetical protein
MLCKIWGFHGCDYGECRLLVYKNPVRTSQETHNVSTTESSRLRLCTIWGINGGDYEECRLLGFKIPVLTSRETHYVSATQPNQLMLCKIWGFHGGDYEECAVLSFGMSTTSAALHRKLGISCIRADFGCMSLNHKCAYDAVGIFQMRSVRSCIYY